MPRKTAAELAALGLKIEAYYGTSMDVEWRQADRRFRITLARPITALPPEPVALK